MKFLCIFAFPKRWVRITVSTQDSQSCNRSSILLPSTKSLGSKDFEAFSFSDGIEKNKLETARRMKGKSYPLAEICELTGLDKETVEELQLFSCSSDAYTISDMN